MKTFVHPLIYVQYKNPLQPFYHIFAIRTITSTAKEKKIQACYRTLNLPEDSNQDAVRRAFLELAKKYHPDSGSPEANMDKFIAIESAFRTITKHNTGSSNSEEIEQIVYNIRHTAPQHRQYLSFEGVGFGTPSQRQKQWAQARAQRASTNVMEHRIAKAVAAENTLMKKGQQYGKKHDIKTKYGFDRLVEDLIQESMSKGEFENLSGKGKPLKDQNRNPYVDFATHKLNEVLINNGFTPEWITLNNEIDQDVELLRKDIINERKVLGPYPLSVIDKLKWDRICESNREFVKTLNNKINKYNLIVPLMNKQKFYVDIEKILDDILQNGPHSMEETKIMKDPEIRPVIQDSESGDFFGLIWKAFEDIFSLGKQNKKQHINEKDKFRN